MRVIYTIDYSPWSAYGGGAQHSTHNLAAAMSRRGHDVSVVYTKPPWEHVEVPPDLPYTVHWAPFLDLWSRRRAPLRPLNAFTVARTVRRLIEPGTATIVHSQGEEGGRIDHLRPDHSFGFVATPHDPHYPEPLLENSSLSLHKKIRLAITDGKYMMQGCTMRSADLCTPPSRYAAERVHRAFQVDPDRVRVVQNGVTDTFLAFTRQPEKARHGPTVFFGRIVAQKGVDTFVEALALLGDEVPPALIIGRGAAQQQIEHRIEQEKLSEHVRMQPWMTEADLGSMLTRARMVVLPSREENFSLSVLSAMAVGAPVISTRVGGTPEIIDDGENGLLVAPDDPGALAAAIARLNQHPALARRLGEAGRKKVRNQFTWEAAAHRFEGLYRELLSRPHS